MKTETKRALNELNGKLEKPTLKEVENFEEKIEVLSALSNLPGVEKPLKVLLERTMQDLKTIQEAAKRELV